MVFERHQFATEGEDAGVFIGDLGRSLVTWAAMQDRYPLTVAEASIAFNTAPDVIREAIDETMWILWTGPDDDPTKQLIELDGE